MVPATDPKINHGLTYLMLSAGVHDFALLGHVMMNELDNDIIRRDGGRRNLVTSSILPLEFRRNFLVII